MTEKNLEKNWWDHPGNNMAAFRNPNNWELVWKDTHRPVKCLGVDVVFTPDGPQTIGVVDGVHNMINWGPPSRSKPKGIVCLGVEKKRKCYEPDEIGMDFVFVDPGDRVGIQEDNRSIVMTDGEKIIWANTYTDMMGKIPPGNDIKTREGKILLAVGVADWAVVSLRNVLNSESCKVGLGQKVKSGESFVYEMSAGVVEELQGEESCREEPYREEVLLNDLRWCMFVMSRMDLDEKDRQRSIEILKREGWD